MDTVAAHSSTSQQQQQQQHERQDTATSDEAATYAQVKKASFVYFKQLLFHTVL
jgi:hypothetical protein